MIGKLGCVLAVVLAIVGCSKKDETVEGPRPTTTAMPVPVDAPAAAASPTGTESDDPALVVPADLDRKAADEISAANLEKQLDVLEKEIGKSK